MGVITSHGKLAAWFTKPARQTARIASKIVENKPTPRYARCRLALVYYRRYAAPLACWRTLGRARVSTRVNPDSVTDELSYFVI